MKKLMTAFLTIMFLLFAGSGSTLAFANEENTKEKEKSAKISIESQKKDIDNIVEDGTSELKDLANYEIKDEGLTSEQKNELLEYKSKASDELKDKIEKGDENQNSFITILLIGASLFMAISVFFAWRGALE